MEAKLTIGICVRNGAQTIQRAVKSAIAEPKCQILLVDDHCTDNTIELAKAIGGERLTIVKGMDPGSLSQARKTAMAHVSTPYMAWLDADDEWVCGRAKRIVEALENEADVYSDPIALYDGATGNFTKELPVPEFITEHHIPVRLFERNHLPCDTQVGFRVSCFAEAGDYDENIGIVESFDIMLRAVAKGARFAFGDQVGYKMYDYPDSLSRKVNKMREAYAYLLKKHSYEDVRTLALSVGYDERVAAWILVSMALYRNQPDMALRFIDLASPADADPMEILEPNGPFPYYEGWRRAFGRGTALLLSNSDAQEAVVELQAAEAIEQTAETANNLGIALWRAGKKDAAKAAFQRALEKLNGYLDATVNLESDQPMRITTHPLRRAPSRDMYSAKEYMKNVG